MLLHDVELRVRALRRHDLIEFAKTVKLPFAPYPWLTLYEGHANGTGGHQVQEVAWSELDKRFVCQLLDDVDAQTSYDDDTAALIRSYAARGWKVRRQVAQPCLYEEPA